ncbi:MAG: glyS [Gammaproteobacteria bacterium]|nr:glyS [Gammaproteobacteria bacterium]
MADKRDLLIEIGTEELPPKALPQLATAFAEEIHNGLLKHNLAHGKHQWYATPRRLAVMISKLVLRQPDQQLVRRGPAVAAAYDAAGKPTKALEGFARSCNADIQALETETTDKGSWTMYRSTDPGQTAVELLPGIIQTALARLPIPRRMRWGAGDAEFVRPVHWSMVLLGREVVPCEILNTRAGNITRGHRFHRPKPLKITSPANYLDKLRSKAFVIADFQERRAIIKDKIEATAAAYGCRAHIDPDLLDEVTALVEWPIAITGSFDPEFLALPDEVLLATLQEHQKYFPMTDDQGRLTANFITIANIDSSAPEEVKKGNERVIRPRLNDAAFFWRRDSAKPLAEYCPGLRDVVYQKNLGTLADKSERLQKLSVFIASELGEPHAAVERAALLAKCDLLTDMVGEFPKLQGTMGRYYARASHEAEDIATAIGDQYLPRFAGDRLPAGRSGQILAIADKLDSLVGTFAIGLLPTGEKDPYGLRRAALGCLRIILEGKLDLDLETALLFAAETFDKKLNANAVVGKVFDFMMERLRGYFLEAATYTVDMFDAVLARRPVRPIDFHARLQAVKSFTGLPEAASLAAANKRIHNILRQAGNGDAEKFAPVIESALMTEAAERDLAGQLQNIAAAVKPLIAARNYTEALRRLSRLRDSVDSFFDNIMVMVEDEQLRLARLQLLAGIRHEFHQIADISRLQV